MRHTYQKFIKNILTPTQIITFGKITSEHFHRHNQEQWPSKAAILLETKRSKMDVNWKWTESLAWHFSEIIVECKEKVEAMHSRWRLRTHKFHIKTNIQFEKNLNLKQNKLSLFYLLSLLSITVFMVDVDMGIVMVLVLVLKTVRVWQPGKSQNM